VVLPHDWNIYQQITDPAGNIIVVGSALDNTRPLLVPIADFAVARYTPDGQLDSSFGNGGLVITALNPFDNGDIAYDVIVQPDGKLVVVGTAEANQYLDETGTVHDVSGGFALVRYNPDGSLDTTFGSGGEVVTPFFSPLTGSSWAQAQALALQPDGSIVVAGWATGPGLDPPPPSSFISGEEDFTVARYTPDGTLDSSFGSGGVVQISFGGLDVANTVAVQSDGTILATGTSERFLYDPAMMGNWPGELFVPMPDPIVDVAVLLNPDGSLITTFGADGGVVSGQPPQDPPSPGSGFDPGSGGDTGGGIGLLNFSLPGSVPPSGPTAASGDTLGSAVPPAASAHNVFPTGPMVTVASPTAGQNLALTQAALVLGGQPGSVTPAPGSDSVHTPTGSTTAVTIGNAANGAGSAASNSFNTGSLSNSRLTPEEPVFSPRGEDNNNVPPSDPLLEPGVLPAALRDDYFAQWPTAPAPQPGDDPQAGTEHAWAGLLAAVVLVAVPRSVETRRGRHLVSRRQTLP
jgi:uncharacterized delta-60 repeat protein